MKLTGMINGATFRIVADTNGAWIQTHGRTHLFVRFNRTTIGIAIYSAVMGSVGTLVALTFAL